MDDELLKRIKRELPPFNESIANGLAVEHMMTVNPETGVNNTLAHIDRLIKASSALFPKELSYEGSRVCTPTRHFEEITREYGSKRIANIAKHDVYLAELQFSYNEVDEMGRKITTPLYPRFVLLPYVRKGGLIHLNGALYNISPVVRDVGYSVTKGSVFIPFNRAKLTFNKTDHHFWRNGVRDIGLVIWSQIHNEMSNRTKWDLDNRKRIESSVAHYFFCQYGVLKTFKDWAKADIQIGYRKDFTEKLFPKSEYVIYESCSLKGIHPAGDICLVLPIDQETEFVKKLVAGFFYVMDTFASRFTRVEYIDDPALWQVILGHMVCGDFEHQGKVMENMETHFHGFNNSLDDMTIEDLAAVGVSVSNIWELLYEIMTSLSHHFYQTDIEETSMYNKRLTVLRYVLDELNQAISMFAYGFSSRRDKDWTVEELNEVLKRTFKLNTATRKLTGEHGELETVNFAGDNMMFRLTSMMVPQDRAKTNKAHSKSLIGDSSRLIHASIAEVGQYRNHPKNNPDGRARANPWMRLSHDGTILRRDDVKELIDATQKRFIRRPGR